ncbi:hypothetical protein GGR52DRAFT_51288 [Hypoxylon sp. FL1284]|nr:hypothetical protein GGR52DRAFT_51288 [Hypoxylon sp. FL1284]
MYPQNSLWYMQPRRIIEAQENKFTANTANMDSTDPFHLPPVLVVSAAMSWFNEVYAESAAVRYMNPRKLNDYNETVETLRLELTKHSIVPDQSGDVKLEISSMLYQLISVSDAITARKAALLATPEGREWERLFLETKRAEEEERKRQEEERKRREEEQMRRQEERMKRREEETGETRDELERRKQEKERKKQEKERKRLEEEERRRGDEEGLFRNQPEGLPRILPR